MATGGAPFDDCAEEQELHNWTISNGSLDDQLNNMQKKANRTSEKNRKKLSAVSESRLTNDISPESTPGAGRRRARTPHSFPHVKYATQMSVPDQAELDRLRQRINFTDLDERSIGSDSQGRVTAANNQRQLSSEPRKPFNFLPLHVNTNKSRDSSASAPPATTTGGKEAKKQSPGKELFAPVPVIPVAPVKEPYGVERTSGRPVVDGRGELAIDSSQVVSKLVQIREYISRASSMRDDLLEKNDVPANVERLSHLITHLKEQEKSYLRFLQKMLARENEEEEEDEGATVDSAVCSGSMAESASLNLEPRSEAADPTCYRVGGQQKEELENLRKQHELLQKMLQQQEELRELQNRQAALLTMQNRAEHAMDDTVVTETTGSVSGVSITSELNDELNDLIRRFHNQLHDTQSQAVPDNRRQAESLSLSREVSRSRSAHSPRGQQTLSAAGAAAAVSTSSASAKLTKLQELQDKKQTMDKILQELHSLRDQTLNNSSCRGASQRVSERPTASGREASGVSVARQESSSYDDEGNPAEKLRKLKEVHKRLNELRELVQYYEQTSDMMVDTVNENVNEDEEDETEDGSLFEAMFDSEQENREPITNIRNPAQPQSASNWMDMNTLTNACSSSNNRISRLNSQCEVNNRSATNLRSLNVPSAIECQYNRDGSYNGAKHGNGDEDDADAEEESGAGRGRRDSSGSGSSQGSSIADDAAFAQKVHRLQTAKQKLQQLRDLVAMVQSDDTDTTAANEDEGLQQQPNNTRLTAPKAKRELGLSDKAREKLYEEKLRQQQQELKQLHEERQRLMEIQGKIQDLQWACPDLQSSMSSAASGVAATTMMKKLPAAASTPAVAPSTSAKSNTAVLKHTTEPAPVTITDNELWSEMRRHQVLREELRQRRKHLESLMAEQQRRSDADPIQSFTQDDRTMATWGGSTQCPLGEEEDDEDYPSEPGAQEDEDEDEEDGAESSSSDEPHSYSNRKPGGSSGKNRDSVKGSSPRCSRSRPRSNPRGAKRQENLRWAADLSASESATHTHAHTHTHWQEQATQLQRQLDFSTAMCQMLLQDQQTLSCMLQSMLTAPYNVLPNNLGSPQVPLIMHQLNQCYTQLAWQQNNINRLKQTLNDLLRQQQQAPSWQQQHPNVAQVDSVSPSPFLPFPPISTLGMNNFSPLATGFNLSPMFPPAGSETQQASGAQASPDQHPDPNMSLKTEYLSFPPPLQRTPLNNAHTRSQDESKNSSWMNSSLNRNRTRDQERLDSHDSLSSVPDCVDPSTVTKSFRPGRKASAQASLASRDKTPKNRRRRGKNHNNAGLDSDSVSSTTELGHEREKERERERERERSSQPRTRDSDQSLLDKLTQEKLDSKTNKHNDVSSAAYAWRTPFLSNQIACTEAPDGSSDFSLFEALRETIYSEVATLISQNESRPHFLIELFHELQLLNTDYLRQRALYSLQDIVTRHLTEKSVAEEPGSSLGPGSQSELTPSESLATTDNDASEKDVRVKVGSRRKTALEGDSVDSESLLSTSSNLEPFASDDLGNTVIHLDKALVRMREFERMKLKAGFLPPAPPPPPVPPAAVSTAPPVCNPELPTVTTATAGGGPALNQGQDIRCPQIDTQQLDRQIKAIMTEVIPFLKEHMGEVCSPQLLTSVRRMVLMLTQQNHHSREFMRFFHKQLGGILQESLNKFVGRTLQNCGEDLLVEISEILFNELAFFRLMQDLDQNTHRAKRLTQTTPTKHTPSTQGKKSEGEKTFSPSYFDEDKDRDETEQGRTSLCLEVETERTDEKRSQDASEAEEEEDEEEEDELPISISLSKAETQALNNYGSGEDENEVEEVEEFEDGSVEVQTSLQASDNTAEPSQCTGVSLNGAAQEIKSDHESTESTEVQSSKSECIEVTEDERDAEATHTLNMDESAVPLAPPSQDSPRGSTTASPQTDSPVLVNADEVGSGNTSQKSDEEDFVKVEDLPVQLSVMCEEELCKQILEEQRSNNLRSELLNGNTEGLSGLVGNAHALKEPEPVGAQTA
ncbi:pericentriolar material 1 protein isoform X4 [Ictalurus punctatus]|uniref:Pericentriolar material 1 protein isoform X4 n=1 Tax=Ictalurus punctatus TaxID=7998 RepID=A0A9F7R3R6_ICTPU|nr:pericentriolar material 1 protein isoform X4 [Ictalurus punctatus]